MTYTEQPKNLPPAMIREFNKWSNMDWRDGATILELIDRVNRVVLCFAVEKKRHGAAESRVKRIFTERSFRHYQTLGCIDEPEKQGKLASYGHRHFLQAILVRKLLQDRLPTEQIALILAGRTERELYGMLMTGVEMVPKIATLDSDKEQNNNACRELVEKWERIRVVTGVELHINANLEKLKPAELRYVMSMIEKVLRKR